MKKVLIITYHWPPGGGSPVLRWLKFSKYLREEGWEPVIYTSLDGEYPHIDHSNEKDIPENITVYRTKVWEPYRIYKLFTGQKKEEKISTGFLTENKKPKLTEKISVWVRGNFFIPDARKFWVKPSVRYLKKKLRENPVDAIVSTGPPHTVHLIARKLKLQLNIPWIADFRDPWTNIDFYHKLMLTKCGDRKHKKMEQKVLKSADITLTVSWNWAKDFQKLGSIRTEVIPNGFDEDDFNVPDIPLDKKFVITHIGSFNEDRNPATLWIVLSELSNDEEFRKDLVIRLIGKVDFKVIDAIKQAGLETNLKKVDYIEHAQVLKELKRSPVLLLPINNTPNLQGIIPGKLFEYLASRRPILMIGPENGDSARIIKESKSGFTFSYDAKEKMQEEILNMYNNFKKNRLVLPDSEINTYSKVNQTRQLAQLLSSIQNK
ncbi:MAG: glycosyltransferase family 4 protein [Bacteroidales bacterium]|nr:glycosyltransferase family 4 protein [Bacteroidales bacterium]